MEVISLDTMIDDCFTDRVLIQELRDYDCMILRDVMNVPVVCLLYNDKVRERWDIIMDVVSRTERIVNRRKIKTA